MDEYYTRMEDIKRIFDLYPFKGCKILCPCDTEKSNFVKYFRDIRGCDVTFSHYNPETGEGTRFQDVDFNGYDYIITNPPFSQTDEFLQKCEGKKFFVVICFKSITDNIVFDNIKNGKWRNVGRIRYYETPDGKIKDMAARVITTEQKRELIIGTAKKVKPPVEDAEYLKYDDYDAYNCKYLRNIDDCLSKIPKGSVIGVPITILEHYDDYKERFELVGSERLKINGKRLFQRILIKEREE